MPLTLLQNQARETAGDPQIASVQGPSNEALQRSPMLVSVRKHREALEKVPDKSRPCPIRKFGLQHFTVGSPQPFSGCDTKRSEIRQNERDDSASVSPISDRMLNSLGLGIVTNATVGRINWLKGATSGVGCERLAMLR